MKLTLDFKEIGSVLSIPNTVLNDKTVDDKMKNFIFMVKEGSVKVVGYNSLTFARTELINTEVEGVDGGNDWFFQIKASEFNKIISSFSNLYKTKVEKIELSEAESRIRVTVFEEAINEEDERLNQSSVFYLANIPIMKNVKKDITMEFPEEVEVLDSASLLLYVDSLIPLMSNDSGNSLASKLNFSEDYVYVISSQINGFFKNKLPDAMKKLTFGYSSVNFLKKLCEGVELLNVCRIDKYMCVQSGTTEAFMRYQPVTVDWKKYLSRMNKEVGVVVDRLYFKDVLKRMAISSQDGKFSISSDGDIEVSNENFFQVIPVNVKKGEVENISFKLPVMYFDKMIIGNDSAFSESAGEIFMYFVPAGVGFLVFMSDKTGAWVTLTQVSRPR